MPDAETRRRHDDDRGATAAEAKRSGRESADPRSQPGEFADDLHTNRFSENEPDTDPST